tara:strand:+ start:1118 stop:1345 length:228 start_codon:yes stop_codon:yes gene_type:complete
MDHTELKGIGITDDEPKFKVGDVVTATTSEGSSLVNGKPYRIVKVDRGMSQWIYWVKGKATGNVSTMAFDNQLKL